MKLITENIDDAKFITEKTEDGKKRLYIEGTFLVAEKVNRNNRMYKMDTLRREVQRYTEEYINKNRALGELAHPSSPQINLDRASHRIISLKEDNNTFYGKALILDTPCGLIAKNLIDGGVSLGVSSRAMGSIALTKEGYNLVQDDLRLSTAADLVHDPSAEVYVQGIMEGKEFWYDMAKGTYIEQDVEKLYETSKSFTKKQIENTAAKLFEWYLDGITRKKI